MEISSKADKLDPVRPTPAVGGGAPERVGLRSGGGEPGAARSEVGAGGPA